MCHDARKEKFCGVPSCLTDEGKPSGTGLQEQVSNSTGKLCTRFVGPPFGGCNQKLVANAGGKGLARGQATGQERQNREGS